MIKPHRVFKKKIYIKYEQQLKKHSRTRTKKKHVQKQMRINQKGKIDQKRKDKHAKINLKKCTTKKEIDIQVIFEFVEVP